MFFVFCCLPLYLLYFTLFCFGSYVHAFVSDMKKIKMFSNYLNNICSLDFYLYLFCFVLLCFYFYFYLELCFVTVDRISLLKKRSFKNRIITVSLSSWVLIFPDLFYIYKPVTVFLFLFFSWHAFSLKDPVAFHNVICCYAPLRLFWVIQDCISYSDSC